MRAHRLLRVLWLTALTASGGCRLVDQRTFEDTGLYPAEAQLHQADYASRALGPPPLALVRLGSPGVDWQTPLLLAVRDAQARKADVQFDLVTPLPSIADPDALQSAGKQAAADAAAVAEVLQSEDVSADHIHIGARANAGNVPREVEVYVR